MTELQAPCKFLDKKPGVHGYVQLPPNGEYAHRKAWELVNGPIPEGVKLRHMCDNRACVEVTHLTPGTHQDNMDDMVERGRSTAKFTPDQLDEIRARYRAGGITQQQLADELGVSISTINYALRRNKRVGRRKKTYPYAQRKHWRDRGGITQ